MESLSLNSIFEELFENKKQWRKIKKKEKIIKKLPIHILDDKELWESALKRVQGENTIKVFAVADCKKVNRGENNRMFIFHSERNKGLAIVRKQVRKYSNINDLKRRKSSKIFLEMIFFLAKNTDEKL